MTGKVMLNDPFGKKCEFDYTNSIKYGFDLYYQNQHIVIYIESNTILTEELSKLLLSIQEILKPQNNKVENYIPAGWEIAIYPSKIKGKE